jgi:raffinose/stachyose/melibiose transport system permease protein
MMTLNKILEKFVGKILIAGINGFLFLFALTAIFPPIWMFYNSLKTNREFSHNIVSLPSRITLENYETIFGSSLVFRALFNSLFNSGIATAAIIAISFVIAYFLARYKFPGRNVLYAFFLFGLLVPIYGLLVPVFIQFRDMGMLNNRFTLLLPYIAFGLSQAIFLIEGYIHSIPPELEEAAYIDGASFTQMLIHIILPICTPVIATAAILSFLATWNEFGFALVLLTGEEFKTIPLWLNTFQGERTVNYTTLMAALTIASIPVVSVYLLFRDKIIQGFIDGALKG